MRLKLALFVMASAGVAFAQSGPLTVVAGLNTVQNRLSATATPDPTVAVGSLEFCEHVNSNYQCWYKNGLNAYQPVNFLGGTTPKLDSSIWSQNGNNFGNTPHCPLAVSPNAAILHDNVYNLWLMQKRISNTANGHSYMCVAISNVEDVGQTSPVAFNWFGFEFDLDTVIPQNSKGHYYYPDYPQAGLWQTSTSTTPPYNPAKDQAMWITYDLQDLDNNDNTIGVLVCAVDIAGLRASAINPWVNNSKTPACVIAHGLSAYTARDNWVPAGNSDTTPPLSSDGEMFTYMIEPPHDGVSYLTDPNRTQGVEQWTIDWTSPAPKPTEVNNWDLPSTQHGGDQLACFDAASYYNTVCIPQPSTSTTNIFIDSVGDRMQLPFHYTSNGGTSGIWTSAHAIQISPNQTIFSQTEADLRVLQWNMGNPRAITLALDKTVIDTHDPNAFVFLPSIARDKVGNLQGIITTSGSGASEHPGLDSIYYIPSTSTLGSYGYIANPSTDGDAEDTDAASYRWGDWSDAVVDPSDSCTVWTVGEYLATNRVTQNFWYTQIARIPPADNCGGGGVIVSPASLNFGNELLQVQSAPQTVTLVNNQSVELADINIVPSGDFSETNTCGSSLPANGSCMISVSFRPISLGTRTGMLAINDNAAGSPQTVGLMGVGVTVPLTLTPSSINFGTQAAGTSSVPTVITLQNSGPSPVTVSSVAASGGFAQSNDCTGAAIPPSAICTISATFVPPLPGAFAGEITVVDNANTSPQLVSLAGSAVYPITFTPTALAFGNIKVGTTSNIKGVTLTNNSPTPLTLSFSATGNFAVAGAGSTPCGSTLAAAGRCTIGATFTPTVNGTVKGVVSIVYNSGFSPQLIGLTGSGTNGSAGPLTFSGSTVTFTNIPVGSTSAAKTVTVTNSGPTTLNITSLVASGDFFATGAGSIPCGGTLAAGASCTFTVTFTPNIVATISGAVNFSYNASTSPQVLALSGTSILPLTLSPSSLTFSAQGVGTTSAPQTVSLTNNLGVTVGLTSIIASGDYLVTTAGTRPCGGTVAAHAQCNINVEFSPTMVGTVVGTLTVNNTAGLGPQEVALTGTGR